MLTPPSRGQQVDFDRLTELGVELEGKIALAKYGGPFRGLKVKNAEEHGMIGTVIFSDTDGDGEITVANGYEAYPGTYPLLHEHPRVLITSSRWSSKTPECRSERISSFPVHKSW